MATASAIAPEILPALDRAAETLTSLGAREVYVFGSAASGKFSPRSDLDLAVRGLPARLYYRAIAELMGVVDRDFDLVDLDDGSPFSELLQEKGKLVRVR